MTDTLELSFTSGLFGDMELCTVRYKQAGDYPELFSVRGKTGGAYRHAGSFQWTSAVQALCAVCLSTILHERGAVDFKPYLAGERNTLASSLDYALSKMPNWLGEMFGANSHGTPRARRLFLTTNPNRKRPGPVIIALNPLLLSATNIVVFLDDRPIADLPLLRRIATLMLQRDLLVAEAAVLRAA